MEIFDRRPSVLIVPVLDLDEAKKWCGEPYRAIVLPGAWTDPRGSKLSIETVSCGRLHLLDAADTAAPFEIERARVLLERVVLGLAHSLHHRLSSQGAHLTEVQKQMLARRIDGFASIPGEPASVYIPEAVPGRRSAPPPISSMSVPAPPTSSEASSDDADAAVADAVAAAAMATAAAAAYTAAAAAASAAVAAAVAAVAADAAASSISPPPAASSTSSAPSASAASATFLSASPSLRVRIVEFQSAAAAHDDDDDNTSDGHPAQDPLLLAVRAAVNWSWRNHQKVLESGEPEPGIHPLEAQAMEEYLAWRDEQQQMVRPRTLQDVANGLHQPDGYRQGDEGNNDEGGAAAAPDDDYADEYDLYESVP
jgi:hypothetical protein